MDELKRVEAFTPGTKVILFEEESYKEAYICTEENHPCKWRDGKTIWVFINDTYHEKNPWGWCVRSHKLHLWTQELWDACQKWQSLKEELDKVYSLLANGKIPKN